MDLDQLLGSDEKKQSSAHREEEEQLCSLLKSVNNPDLSIDQNNHDYHFEQHMIPLRNAVI